MDEGKKEQKKRTTRERKSRRQCFFFWKEKCKRMKTSVLNKKKRRRIENYCTSSVYRHIYAKVAKSRGCSLFCVRRQMKIEMTLTKWGIFLFLSTKTKSTLEEMIIAIITRHAASEKGANIFSYKKLKWEKNAQKFITLN